MNRLPPLFLLLSLAAAANNPAAPAEAPSNRWRYPASCTEIEPVAFDVMKRAHFVPNGETLEEWAIAYHWSHGPISWPSASSAVKKLTQTHSGLFDTWYSLLPVGTGLRFIREAGGRRCLTEIWIQYSGLKSGVAVEGNYELVSNNASEHSLLAAMGDALNEMRQRAGP